MNSQTQRLGPVSSRGANWFPITSARRAPREPSAISRKTYAISGAGIATKRR